MLKTILLTTAICCFGATALAQEHRLSPAMTHQHHGEFHDVYKTWCMPGSEKPCPRVKSCCDGRVIEGDLVDGDCYATEFRLIDGKRWIAKLDEHDRKRSDDGAEWIDIPDDRIIREKNPDSTGTRGHVCTARFSVSVLCAVPPAGVL